MTTNTTNTICENAYSNRYMNFHFEYSLETQKHELDGKEYISYGISAKMVDEYGEEEIMSIQDITLEQADAQHLILLLESFKISPMCLKMFVEDFLVNQANI